MAQAKTLESRAEQSRAEQQLIPNSRAEQVERDRQTDQTPRISQTRGHRKTRISLSVNNVYG
jgi:hypothetical protein